MSDLGGEEFPYCYQVRQLTGGPGVPGRADGAETALMCHLIYSLLPPWFTPYRIGTSTGAARS